MTRKDYQAVANRFAAQMDAACDIDNPQHRALIRDTVDTLAEEMADVFASDNPNFDRNRFLTACGIEHA